MNKSYVSINVRKCTFDNGSGKCMLEKTYRPLQIYPKMLLAYFQWHAYQYQHSLAH